jgi:hypothetical protein
MCTVSTVIDGWRDHTWPMPQYPGNPQTLPVYPFIPAPEQPPHTVAAPEIDPSAGFTAVLLLAGLLAVLTGRRVR